MSVVFLASSIIIICCAAFILALLVSVLKAGSHTWNDLGKTYHKTKITDSEIQRATIEINNKLRGIAMTPYDWFIGVLSFQTYYRIVPNLNIKYSWDPKWLIQKWRWYWPFFTTLYNANSKKEAEEWLIEYQEGIEYFSYIFKD